MPTLEQIDAANVKARLDALDAAAVALGAPNAASALAWFAAAAAPEGQMNLANPNSSGLAAAITTPRGSYAGVLW